MAKPSDFSFTLGTRLEGAHGRTGTIHTPHGDIQTPAYIPVGTKATVKAVLPEVVKELGAQAVLSNAYHLYLQPGPELLDKHGGLSKFMNWRGPTFTDSGGFQVMSLGSGFKKVIDMSGPQAQGKVGSDDAVAPGKERLANVDDDGVWFTSHINGDRHRFTPEISMNIQHQLGADIMMALTSSPPCTTRAVTKWSHWNVPAAGHSAASMNTPNLPTHEPTTPIRPSTVSSRVPSMRIFVAKPAAIWPLCTLTSPALRQVSTVLGLAALSRRKTSAPSLVGVPRNFPKT